jgi:hypothetical protein
MSTPIAEIENPLPTIAEPELPVRQAPVGTSLLERMLIEGEGDAIEKIEKLTKALDTLRRHSIRATYPADWVIHVSKDTDGNILRQVGYLQDCGAERAGKVWGVQIQSPVIEREDFADGTYCYHLLATAASKVTGEVVENVEGSRWSGDKFFLRSIGPDEKVDPTDVRKSAWANLHGRAVRQLCGLNAVPLDMLEACGIDLRKVVHIGYEKGAKGGEATGAAVGGSDPVIGWGNAKGKAISELAEADLQWYIVATRKSVNDPDKAKFRKHNERLLAALEAELERRKLAKEQGDAGGTTEADARTRGQKLTALNKRLLSVAKRLGTTAGELLQQISQDAVVTVSDLSDAELDRISALSDDQLAGAPE